MKRCLPNKNAQIPLSVDIAGCGGEHGGRHARRAHSGSAVRFSPAGPLPSVFAIAYSITILPRRHSSSTFVGSHDHCPLVSTGGFISLHLPDSVLASISRFVLEENVSVLATGPLSRTSTDVRAVLLCAGQTDITTDHFGAKTITLAR